MPRLDIPYSFLGGTSATATKRLTDVAQLGTWSEVLPKDQAPIDNRVMWWLDDENACVHVVWRSV